MIEQIIDLRKRGLSFRKIAKELNTTVGKVQYQWKKYKEGKIQLDSIDDQKRTAKVNTPADHFPTFQFFSETNDMFLTLIQPTKAFVYWSISNEVWDTVALYYRELSNEKKLCLRVYDVTNIHFNGSNAHSIFEIPIPPHCEEWMLKGLKGNRCYCVELGLKHHHDFLPLLRSNTIHVPLMNEAMPDEFQQNIRRYVRGEDQQPKWVEHVSVYSYYINN
ncbi:MAG: DUF4912 domain-containing protein [Bacillus sp. (in: Bacteria)]|nr:DUF4912 domain-containing protein [Bacillus sp. (in: firmicutes)]